MLVPSYYGFLSGYYLNIVGSMEEVHIARAFPGRLGHDDVKVKTSWLHQGMRVANGNEVSHSKLMKGVLPGFKTSFAGSDYYIMSGDFTNPYNQGYAELFRHRSDKSIDLIVYHTDSKLRVIAYIGWSDDRFYPSHPYATFEIFRWSDGSYTNYGCSGCDFNSMKTLITLASAGYDLTRYGYWPLGDCLSIARELMDMLLDRDHLFTPISRAMTRLSTLTYSAPRPAFVLDEPNTLLGSDPIMVPYGAYHLKALRQAAYLDALSDVATLNDNTLSNVAEIIGTIRDLVVHRKIEVPDSLAKVWLAYRYQYQTTKLDTKEALSYVKRTSEDLSRGFSCYGSASGNITSSVTAVVKCSMHMKSKELSMLNTLCAKLYEYGLSPSSYVIWDFIPYSFIIDWLIPVGDILHSHDMDRQYHEQYDITDLWYSLSYDVNQEGNVMHSYTRWNEQSTPELNGFYTIETQHHASNKVLGFRVLDSASLIFSR